jgi:hypothetical protein
MHVEVKHLPVQVKRRLISSIPHMLVMCRVSETNHASNLGLVLKGTWCLVHCS